MTILRVAFCLAFSGGNRSYSALVVVLAAVIGAATTVEPAKSTEPNSRGMEITLGSIPSDPGVQNNGHDRDKGWRVAGDRHRWV